MTFEKWDNVQPKQSNKNQETWCLNKNPAAILRERPIPSHIPIFSRSVKIGIDKKQQRVLATPAVFHHSARFSPMLRNYFLFLPASGSLKLEYKRKCIKSNTGKGNAYLYVFTASNWFCNIYTIPKKH